jgi:hypothetical protein
VGYAVNAHAENLVPGESLDAGGGVRITATYTVTANGGTDSFVRTDRPGTAQPQGPIDVSGWREVDVDVFLTSITGTSIQFLVDRQGTDGRWYNVAAGTALTAASTGTTGNGGTVVSGGTSLSIGPGMSGTNGVAVGLGKAMRVRWVGVALTTATFTLSVIGKS